MAPVTRRSLRISQQTTNDEPDPSSSNAATTDEATLVKKPASSRGKRKSTENDDRDESEQEGGGAPLDDEPSASPKRQRLTVRTREDESTAAGRKTHIEVEIPVGQNSTMATTAPMPRSDLVPDSQEEDEDGPEPEPLSASRQLEEGATHRLASQSLEPEQTPANKPKPKPKGKHITFDDEEDVNNFVADAAAATVAATATKKAEDSDGDDEDDDDAPEAVSTQAVAKEMQRAAQSATEAAEKQAASLKRKRQEKDSLYKQQAERRKRARGVEVHQSKGPAGTALPEDDTAAEIEKAVTTVRHRHQQQQQRTGKSDLPDVLPAEFLTDSSSDSDSDSDGHSSAPKKRKLQLVQGKNKAGKINFEDGDRPPPPRDVTVGSTRYRVLATRADDRLAPRLHKNARASKDGLLRRNRAAAPPSLKRGFFVKR
ncbi:hypothetical protein GGR52DRAFT_18021 [Hypoxylon sp. FL1284]|nr:hypothetical protein GGR52DRAFT_18021 [Hypoxylon sp. FL1284]